MTDDKEILLSLLEKHLDMYKFYFEMAIKINLFFYGITGAILSYYYSNKNINVQLVFSLVVPIFFSGLLTVIFVYGARSLKPIQNEIEKISAKLDTYGVISVKALKLFLQSSATLFIVVFFGLLFGEIWPLF